MVHGSPSSLANSVDCGSKLGIRNTAGHPSTVTVHGSKAANFIEDLVENVILKFSI
jgi:hypothetical protein